MSSTPYDVLFEPVKIGPVTAPNRFYQVPHCNGLGHLHPQAEAANRGIKAAGGWGVVCTQEVEIHPTSEISPASEGRIWDERDVDALRLTTDAIHEHGALAGIELVYNGSHAPNRYSRVAPMAPVSSTVDCYDPVQARAMDRQDLRNLRQWYVDAAMRAKRAGFDIVYVYAGHNMTLLQHFLTPRSNQRTDEYGGSLENRVRLLKETLLDVQEAVGTDCALAMRFAVEELMGSDGIEASGEGREIVEMLADIPDLWDVNVSDWSNDSATARFEPNEGYQDHFTQFVKEVTSKPVVGVGRYTSPDAMVARIKSGVLDFIGAARPSIADPWLPTKIREGRVEDIRECIGCNICVSCDNLGMPIRCTQNPTMGQEWKRGWHPETIEAAGSDSSVLVVGAGPAGLECTYQLANRGYKVMLAESSKELGGRALRESALPGLSSYARVADFRINQIRQMSDVEIFLDNELSGADIASLGVEHVMLATGSRWRFDAAGREHGAGLVQLAGIDENSAAVSGVRVVTPDMIMAGEKLTGEVVIYDDDHYYMGGVLAEKLAIQGCSVTLATPASMASCWTEHTLELEKIQRRLHSHSIDVVALSRLSRLDGNAVVCEGLYTGVSRMLPADVLCVVSSRAPNNSLLQQCESESTEFKTLKLIGDAYAPSTIAEAVYSGHLAAREMDQDADPLAALYIREVPALP